MTEHGALLAELIDLLPVGVWIARAPNGEFVFANRVFREIMGTEARDDVVAGEYAAPYGIQNAAGEPYPEQDMPFVRALRAGAIVTVDDIVIARTDGRRVNIRATARPWTDPGSAATYIIITFEDITAEVAARRAQAAGEQRMREGQRLESLGTLATGIAHDFNNVLASISMIATQARVRAPAGADAADFGQIEAAVESAAQLTRALLAFGRARPGRSVPLDFATTVQGVVALARRTFEPNTVVSVEVRGSAIVTGDPGQLEQLCLNLIINAREAMPQGGEIRVVTDMLVLASPPAPLSPGRHVVLTVSDAGPGIPAELRAKIFEPYFTTKTGAERQGTGLGLATVRAVAQGLGGTVEVEDAHPTGTVFRVTLPVSASHAAAATDTQAPPVVPGTGTVLLVEDMDTVRRATRRALELVGYEVLEARDGTEAIEKFAAHGPVIRAVLMDAVLPRMSGGEATAELRRRAPSLPIIVTSGRVERGDVATVLASGATAFLPKPFTTAELSEAIAAALASPADARESGVPPMPAP